MDLDDALPPRAPESPDTQAKDQRSTSVARIKAIEEDEAIILEESALSPAEIPRLHYRHRAVLHQKHQENPKLPHRHIGGYLGL